MTCLLGLAGLDRSHHPVIALTRQFCTRLPHENPVNATIHDATTYTSFQKRPTAVVSSFVYEIESEPLD